MANSKFGAVVNSMIERFKAGPDEERRRAIVRALAAHIGHKQAGQLLVSLLTDEPVLPIDWRWDGPTDLGWRNTAYCLLTGELCSEQEAFDAFAGLATEHPLYSHRQEALSRLAKIFSGQAETFAILKGRADHDDDLGIRNLALQLILHQYAECPDSQPYLVRILLSRHTYLPQSEAMDALAAHHARHPETRDLLKCLASHGETAFDCQGKPLTGDRVEEDGEYVRKGHFMALNAIKCLGGAFPYDPEIYEDLLTRAENSEHWREAGVVFRYLTELYADRPETLPMILARAERAAAWPVRDGAVAAIEKLQSSNARIFPVLSMLAKKDVAHEVRLSAVRALATLYPQDDRAEAVIVNRANSDRKVFVRDKAVQMLGKHFAGSETAMSCLIRRLETDRSPAVRERAGDALMEGFRDNLTARRILKEAGYMTLEDRVFAAARAIFKPTPDVE